MKRVLIAFMCCVFAVALAVSGCSKKEAAGDSKDKAATEEKAAKGGEKAEKAAPKEVNGVQALAEQMCKAGLEGDVEGLINSFPPQMFDKMAEQMAEYGMEGDPRDMFREEMSSDAMLDSCEIVSAKETECSDSVTASAKEMGIETVEACGAVELKIKPADKEEEESEEMPAIKVEGKWYVGGDM
jgi:predicted lipid-binding transport protein (Tim44 family)